MPGQTNCVYWIVFVWLGFYITLLLVHRSHRNFLPCRVSRLPQINPRSPPRSQRGVRSSRSSAAEFVERCKQLVPDPPNVAWMVKTAPKHCTKTGRCGEVQDSWAARAACYNQTITFFDAGAAEGLRSRSPLFEFMPFNGSHSTAMGKKEMAQWQLMSTLHPDADWYAAADDDTYFLVDNILRWLKTKDASKPVVLGRRFRIDYMTLTYDSGGAGFIVSHAGLWKTARLLDTCSKRWPLMPGDVCAGQCFNMAGLEVADTRDKQGRERFHPFTYPLHRYHTNYKATDWYWRYTVPLAPLHEGRDCCSANESLSFHYMSGRMRQFRWPPERRLGCK